MIVFLEVSALKLSCSCDNLCLSSRFNTLAQEMNAVTSQIENVNNASEALFESGHPNRMQVKQGQDHMNAR